MSKNEPLNQDELEGNPYLGNIWGWKISFIGLFVISIFALLAMYLTRQNKLNPPKEKTPIELKSDSLTIDSLRIK